MSLAKTIAEWTLVENVAKRLDEWDNREEGCDPIFDEIVGDVTLLEQQHGWLLKRVAELEADRDKYHSALEWLRNQFCDLSPGDKGQWRICWNRNLCLTEYCASCYAAAMLEDGRR